MLQQGHATATGVAQKTVSLTSLRSFNIPLPPLTTQKAIVADIQAEDKAVRRRHLRRRILAWLAILLLVAVVAALVYLRFVR